MALPHIRGCDTLGFLGGGEWGWGRVGTGGAFPRARLIPLTFGIFEQQGHGVTDYRGPMPVTHSLYDLPAVQIIY
jgi:hypothetical protein